MIKCASSIRHAAESVDRPHLIMVGGRHSADVLHLILARDELKSQVCRMYCGLSLSPASHPQRWKARGPASVGERGKDAIFLSSHTFVGGPAPPACARRPTSAGWRVRALASARWRVRRYYVRAGWRSARSRVRAGWRVRRLASARGCTRISAINASFRGNAQERSPLRTPAFLRSGDMGNRRR